jgi:hypothetical protein
VDVIDGRATGIQGLNAQWVGIYARDFEAGLGEGDCERQPDVAEADNPDMTIGHVSPNAGSRWNGRP